ncbi:hypothetical protein H7347_06780 [Corynebacterium sp. zg-331]|uniref:hypothetical protein n=1 Tax=unclassified Corynebacterium TaxID=2624378 RepID=UPI00128D58FE|nr:MULTISPECIES: hypothetical protein [unclassified Corynebacterium]MBC3186276.1 hypothetical protein [Corynebacterium sp. zg-331]MPV52765.1 hypothetical protein [Corynebacterium sp. zg331]
MPEGLIIAVVTAASGLMVGLWQRHSAQEETAASQYQSLVHDLEGLRKELWAENSELRSQLRALQAEYEQLRRDLARMEGEEAALRERYRVAVDYIVVLYPLVPVARRPPVPEVLREDVK